MTITVQIDHVTGFSVQFHLLGDSLLSATEGCVNYCVTTSNEGLLDPSVFVFRDLCSIEPPAPGIFAPPSAIALLHERLLMVSPEHWPLHMALDWRQRQPSIRIAATLFAYRELLSSSRTVALVSAMDLFHRYGITDCLSDEHQALLEGLRLSALEPGEHDKKAIGQQFVASLTLIQSYLRFGLLPNVTPGEDDDLFDWLTG